VRLDWPDCRNVRDLGLLPTDDGRQTRSGALIRADNLDRLTPTGIAAVEDLRPAIILDVRARWEAERFPGPFTDVACYRNVPLSVDVPRDAQSLLDDYLLIVDSGRGQVAAAVIAVAEASAGPVVVHCHAGKDRTGILVAVLLDLCGVPVEAIAADYALTDGADPDVIRGLLAHLAGTYGGSVDYLLGAGLRPAQLAAVRKRMDSQDR